MSSMLLNSSGKAAAGRTMHKTTILRTGKEWVLAMLAQALRVAPVPAFGCPCLFLRVAAS